MAPFEFGLQDLSCPLMGYIGMFCKRAGQRRRLRTRRAVPENIRDCCNPSLRSKPGMLMLFPLECLL